MGVPVDESGCARSGPQQPGSSLTGQVAAVLSPVKVEENTLVRPSGESHSFLGVVMPTCRSSIQQAEARS